MTTTSRILACLACALAGVASAQPEPGPSAPGRAGQIAGMVPWAERIKLYCGNPRLTFQVDWPAFERIDFQVLIAGEEGGRDGSRASSPEYIAKSRSYIIDGTERRGDLAGSPVAGSAGFIAAPLERLCRDHKDYRARVARITTIKIEPIYDMAYLRDQDAIAFARKTNDWTGVEQSWYETKRRDDDADLHAYRWRWKVSGSTLTVALNVLSKSGNTDEDVDALIAAFGGGGAEMMAPDSDAPSAEAAPAPAGGPWDGRYTVVSSRGGNLCPRPDALPLVVSGDRFVYPWRLGSGLVKVGQLSGDVDLYGDGHAAPTFDHPYPRSVAALAPAKLDRVSTVKLSFANHPTRTATLELDLGADLRCTIVWVAPGRAPAPPPRVHYASHPSHGSPPPPRAEPPPSAASGPTREQREARSAAHLTCENRCYGTHETCRNRSEQDERTCQDKCPSSDIDQGRPWGQCVGQCTSDRSTTDDRCDEDEQSCESGCPPDSD